MFFSQCVWAHYLKALLQYFVTSLAYFPNLLRSRGISISETKCQHFQASLGRCWEKPEGCCLSPSYETRTNTDRLASDGQVELRCAVFNVHLGHSLHVLGGNVNVRQRERGNILFRFINSKPKQACRRRDSSSQSVIVEVTRAWHRDSFVLSSLTVGFSHSTPARSRTGIFETARRKRGWIKDNTLWQGTAISLMQISPEKCYEQLERLE